MPGLKLNTASGGSITLQETDTASNVTLTLPAATATLLTTSSDLSASVKSSLNASGSAPIYACRAWVNFNGTGTVAIRGSGNISSITDNSTGDYTVNLTTAIEDTNYSLVAFAVRTTDETIAARYTVAPTSSAIRIQAFTRAGAAVDPDYFNVAIFR